MSLDFSVKQVNNYNVLTTLVINDEDGAEYARRWHPVTDALIWATMSLGINRITEANWTEFYQRLHMFELVRGAQLFRCERANDPKNYITAMEVYAHIGLATNASNKTQVQFLKDLYEASCRTELATVTKAPDKYESSGLATMGEAEFQEKQRFETRAEMQNWDGCFVPPVAADKEADSVPA